MKKNNLLRRAFVVFALLAITMTNLQPARAGMNDVDTSNCNGFLSSVGGVVAGGGVFVLNIFAESVLILLSGGQYRGPDQYRMNQIGKNSSNAAEGGSRLLCQITEKDMEAIRASRRAALMGVNDQSQSWDGRNLRSNSGLHGTTVVERRGYNVHGDLCVVTRTSIESYSNSSPRDYLMFVDCFDRNTRQMYQMKGDPREIELYSRR